MPDELSKSEYYQDVTQLIDSLIGHLKKAKSDADELMDMNHADFDNLYALICELIDVSKAHYDNAETELSNCIKEDRDFQERNWREDV